MIDSGSATVSRDWSRCLSGGTSRLIAIHFFAEHTHDTVLFVHQVLILVDEDANLILQYRDLVLVAADCSGQQVGEGHRAYRRYLQRDRRFTRGWFPFVGSSVVFGRWVSRSQRLTASSWFRCRGWSWTL